MSGICGFCDFGHSGGTLERREEAHRMGETLNHRGPEDRGLWQGNRCVLAHRRPRGQSRQPLVRRVDGADCVLVFDGALYDLPDLRRALAGEGWTFDTQGEAEALLAALILWGERAAERLDGAFAFAFWDGRRERLICGRDRLGVRPFFYAWQEGTFVFASEPKALFQYPGLEPRLGRDGLREVLGLCPVRTPGVGVFEGVMELPPATQLVLGREEVRRAPYWQLVSRPHREDYPETVERVRELLQRAVTLRLEGEEPLCAFLSGGLDSAFVTALAAQAYTESGRKPLDTLSLRYAGRRETERSFFRPDDQGYYVQWMAEVFHTRQRTVTCDTPALANLLADGAAARDLPGMGAADSALLYLSRQAARSHKRALAGVGADPLFGGWSWCDREEPGHGFPWEPDLEARRAVFDKGLWTDLQVEDYVRERRRQTLAACPRLEEERGFETRRRELGWLALTCCLPAQLEQWDRMTMASGLEVRLPFCDHRLVEYAWNIPWAMKGMNGQRKQVLRDAALGLLPEGVRTRPKTPCPQGADPLYDQLVRAGVARILEAPNAPIHSLADRAALDGLLTDQGRGPAATRTLAYLIQLNAWMERFHLTV